MFSKNSSEKKSVNLLDICFNICYKNNRSEAIAFLEVNKNISMKDISKIDIYGLMDKVYSFNKSNSHLTLTIESEEKLSINFENFYSDIMDEYECKLAIHKK